MPQNKIYLQTMIRAVSFIAAIFFLVLGVKAYLGYLLIQDTIEQNNAKYIDLTTKLNYTTNFYIPYLKSDYAGYFVNHEHGFANDKEIIIKLVKDAQVHIPSVVINPSLDDATGAMGGRKEFFDYKLNKSLKW